MGYYLSVGVHLQISRGDIDKGKLVVAATIVPWKKSGFNPIRGNAATKSASGGNIQRDIQKSQPLTAGR